MGTERLKYHRILQSVAMTPWAMEHAYWLKVVDVLEFQAAGLKLTAEEIRAHTGIRAADRPRSQQQKSVAVIGLRGVIEHRAEQIDDVSGPGGTSVEGFRKRFRQAMSIPEVGAIVLDVDSPGGSVDGVPELAAEIREARGQGKPILASINTLGASAAYFIASAADQVSITSSGQVGSIGVFAAHEDIAARLEADGRKVTLVHAGKYKVEGNPFEPLSDEARDHLQARVDAYYSMFVDAVAEGRDVERKAVTGGMGEGRVLGPKEAMKEKMVDRIETLEQTIQRALTSRPRKSARGQMAIRERLAHI